MMTGTSGVSGLTGGNCTREEWNRSRATSTPTAGEALAADLRVPFNRFAEVFKREGTRFSDEAHQQMEQALTELGGTIIALRR
jgi:uncharacterized membrane protein